MGDADGEQPAMNDADDYRSAMCVANEERCDGNGDDDKEQPATRTSTRRTAGGDDGETNSRRR